MTEAVMESMTITPQTLMRRSRLDPLKEYLKLQDELDLHILGTMYHDGCRECMSEVVVTLDIFGEAKARSLVKDRSHFCDIGRAIFIKIDSLIV